MTGTTHCPPSIGTLSRGNNHTLVAANVESVYSEDSAALPPTNQFTLHIVINKEAAVLVQMSPRHGRIFVCQASVFAGVPFSVLLFKVRTAPLL